MIVDLAGPRPASIDGYWLVLGGGVALGAYQAGVYAEMHTRDILPSVIVGASIGSINGAIIAGNPEKDRIEALSRFWSFNPNAPDPQAPDSVRHVENWLSAIQARLLGVRDKFVPRMGFPSRDFNGLYDLSPLRRRIEDFIDFDLLNSGSVRFVATTTDMETGEQVLVDTSSEGKIGVDHLLASCGLPPEFGVQRMDGRVLGDGGLYSNLPLDLFLRDNRGSEFCIAVDLFSPVGEAPRGLEDASSRKTELIFANQTARRIESFKEERCRIEKIRKLLSAARCDDEVLTRFDALVGPAPQIMLLSYRAPDWEAGPERLFDFGSQSIVGRWRAGARDFAEVARSTGALKAN